MFQGKKKSWKIALDLGKLIWIRNQILLIVVKSLLFHIQIWLESIFNIIGMGKDQFPSEANDLQLPFSNLRPNKENLEFLLPDFLS